MAVWFPLILGGAGWLQPCPMHGAGHAMGAMSTMTHAPAGDGAMAMHGHGVTAQSSATDSQQSPAPSNAAHHCTCIECCGIGIAAVLAPTQPVVALAVADISAPPSVSTAESLPRLAPDHSRPHTTGPPRA